MTLEEKGAVMESGKRGLLREVFLEDAKLDEKGHEVAAGDVVHDKVKIVPVLVNNKNPVKNGQRKKL